MHGLYAGMVLDQIPHLNCGAILPHRPVHSLNPTTHTGLRFIESKPLFPGLAGCPRRFSDRIVTGPARCWESG